MDKYILWFDIETTGLDPVKHGIIQIAGLIELNGEIKQDFNFKIKPFRNDLLNKDALKITKITKNDLMTYIDPLIIYKKMMTILNKYVNPYDKNEKFILAGKNIKNFDIPFLRNYFKKCNDNYFGAWFESMCIDIDVNVAEAMLFNDLHLSNYRLSTLCQKFDIEIDAHNALSDIIATRNLYYKLKGIDLE